MNEQRNVVIGLTSLVVIVGLIFWFSSNSQPVRENTSLNPVSKSSDVKPSTRSQNNFHIESNSAEVLLQPNHPTSYIFSIIDDQGSVENDFAVVHEKIMHVIIVRHDLQEFQHVHPTFNEQTGVFTLDNLTFSREGRYRVFTDFSLHKNHLNPIEQPFGLTIYEDLTVGNLTQYSPQPLSAVSKISTNEGYTVSLEREPVEPVAGTMSVLSLTVSLNGQPVTNLEPYLGALGHAVVLSENDLSFIHAHPINEDNLSQNGQVQFQVNFPKAGNYKVFAQFKHQEKVFTSEFVVPITAGASMIEQRDLPPIMDHSQH